MTSEHVNELTTLSFWLKDIEERLHNLKDLNAPAYAVLKSQENYEKFVTLTADLELHNPIQLYEDEDDEENDEEDDDKDEDME